MIGQISAQTSFELASVVEFGFYHACAVSCPTACPRQ